LLKHFNNLSIGEEGILFATFSLGKFCPHPKFAHKRVNFQKAELYLITPLKNATILNKEQDKYLILIIISKSGYMSSTNLGKRIKQFRSRLKISQDQLAKKADIPFSTLVKIEAWYTPNPSMETLIKIADAFEIGLDELVGR